ncbi:MAG: hypothetical protein ACT4OF_12810 [Caulobacteraceae bacterium]
MAPSLRDLLMLIAALATAIVMGAILRFFPPSRWEMLLGVGVVFAAYAAVKFIQPSNKFVVRVAWSYLAMVFIILEAVILLLTDFSILGYWTIPSVICLGLLYCVLHLVLVGDDGRRPSR